jgi:hypothetical protein
LAQFQQQLDALNAGVTVPNFAATRPTSTTLSPAASSSVPAYTCGAFGSNHYTAVINTAGTIGYAKLGFLEECNTPDEITSSCEISATGGKKHSKPGTNTNGGRNCSTDTVFPKSFRGTKGVMKADWGAYNSTGQFAQLAGCVVDGKTAYCKYRTTFRVGHNSYFGWEP